ncbi:MAG: hypothetical protein Q3M24_01235 [Candidatus Electrothrix aestuarii]|uniref:Uncharacterized protein n=1 Tax=Candidatus Electrothrix aestuarii TaxID=3062594 RepID=A0AAU8LWZ2_9BACT|nr:hypothetical protein [Candidatus Electrothrix aestuarii]
MKSSHCLATQKENSNSLILHATPRCIARRILAVTACYLTFNIPFIYIFFTTHRHNSVIAIAIILISISNIYEIFSKINIYLKIDKPKDMILVENLWRHITKQPIKIDCKKIRNILIQDNGRDKKQELYDYFNTLSYWHSQIFIQTRKGKSVRIYSTSSDADLNIIAHKVGRYLNCPVFSE